VDLRSALVSLNLDELSVDVTSTKLELQDELSKLRAVVEHGVVAASAAPVPAPVPAPAVTAVAVSTSSATSAEMVKLKAQLEDVQKLLAEAQKLQQSSAAGSAALQSQLTKLQTDNASLNDQLRRNASQGSDKDGSINKLSSENASLSKELAAAKQTITDELPPLRSEIATLKKRLADTEALNTSNQKDAEKKLIAKVKEARDAGDKKLQEQEKLWTAEKDELETALAQEIEVFCSIYLLSIFFIFICV
jgi:chromosome segregation ATPase